MAATLYLVLNSSENGGYHCLVPDFHRNASGFTALRYCGMSWLRMLIITLKYYPSIKKNLWALHCNLGISTDLYLNKMFTSKNRSKFSIFGPFTLFNEKSTH